MTQILVRSVFLGLLGLTLVGCASVLTPKTMQEEAPAREEVLTEQSGDGEGSTSDSDAESGRASESVPCPEQPVEHIEYAPDGTIISKYSEGCVGTGQTLPRDHPDAILPDEYKNIPPIPLPQVDESAPIQPRSPDADKTCSYDIATQIETCE